MESIPRLKQNLSIRKHDERQAIELRLLEVSNPYGVLLRPS